MPTFCCNNCYTSEVFQSFVQLLWNCNLGPHPLLTFDSVKIVDKTNERTLLVTPLGGDICSCNSKTIVPAVLCFYLNSHIVKVIAYPEGHFTFMNFLCRSFLFQPQRLHCKHRQNCTWNFLYGVCYLPLNSNKGCSFVSAPPTSYSLFLYRWTKVDFKVLFSSTNSVFFCDVYSKYSDCGDECNNWQLAWSCNIFTCRNIYTRFPSSRAEGICQVWRWIVCRQLECRVSRWVSDTGKKTLIFCEFCVVVNTFCNFCMC